MIAGTRRSNFGETSDVSGSPQRTAGTHQAGATMPNGQTRWQRVAAGLRKMRDIKYNSHFLRISLLGVFSPKSPQDNAYYV